jgi:hypothetical protein
LHFNILAAYLVHNPNPSIKRDALKRAPYVKLQGLPHRCQTSFCRGESRSYSPRNLISVFSLMSAVRPVAAVKQKGVDSETTNGHSRLHYLQRTLMKDARRGLHSLVGAQPGFPDCYLPRDDRAFPSAGPNFSLINDKSSHGDIYNFNSLTTQAI